MKTAVLNAKNLTQAIKQLSKMKNKENDSMYLIVPKKKYRKVKSIKKGYGH